ncbi:MAG: substrate-binding domain-containing protein [Micrococcales bacterium]|nr:substrate-binding domain-containing protein [Micrococcales bacterium]
MSPPRHANPASHRRGAALTVVAVTVAVLLLAGIGVTVTRLAFGGDEVASGCGQGPTQLHVAAAPAIAPVVAELGRDRRIGPDGPGCVDVVVESVDPQAEIQSLADGTVRPPDVWIPDSTLWLDRAGVERVAKATNAASVASSPLVLAVSTREADRVRGTATRPTVANLAAIAAGGGSFSVELSDQRLSPARVGTILALTKATADMPDGRASLTALIRGATVSDSSAQERLAILSPTASVGVPVSERDVWVARGESSPAQPVAIYAGGVSFDFPFAVLAKDPATISRAQGLFDVLTGATGQAALKAAGFRDVHGSAGVVLTADRGVDGTTTIPPCA